MLERHRQHSNHVLESVIGHVRAALAPLDQHKLIRAHHHVVLILEENNVVVGVDDARQMSHVAERASVVSIVDERHRLRAANGRIEFYQIEIHRAHSVLESYLVAIDV